MNNIRGKVGVGLVGAGEWAGTHADAFRKYPDLCELVAFADPVAGRAEARAREFGARAGFLDYREMLKRDDIHLVSIATPPSTHSAAAVDSLAAGKHVLCEKPLAASLEECDRMISAADASGLAFCGVFQNRFYRNVMQAKSLLDSGELGKPVLLSLDGLWWRGPEYFAVDWRGTWEGECGGTLLNHHSHLLDVALHLAGDAAWVDAEMGTLTRPADVEDTIAFVMRMKNGAILSAMASSAAEQGEIARLELGAERGALTIELYGASPLKLWCAKSSRTGFPGFDEDRAKRLHALADRKVPPFEGEGLPTIVRNAVMAARGEEKPLVPGREARRVIEHIFGAYKSASTGGRVALPLVKDDPFYTRAGVLANVKRGGKKPK